MRIRRSLSILSVFVLGFIPTMGISAQVSEVVADTLSPDSTTTAVVVQPGTRIDQRLRVVERAPLSPGRAFLTSLVVPGLGQARLQRSTSGALYAAVEVVSFAMLRRANAEMKSARAMSRDTIPGNFTVNQSTGEIVPTTNLMPRYIEGLDRTRKLQVEDWIAALAFNHLISASDAFVASHLWDVPVARVSLSPTPDGMMLIASFTW